MRQHDIIPKVIHICWFSGDSYPVEVRECMDSWKRILPDFKIRVWTEADARALGMTYVNEALDCRKWAFAADVIRFYAVWKEGGVYMDSDVILFKRFDDILSIDADFITFHEKCGPQHEDFGLQAAMFMGTPGNQFCAEMVDYYRGRHFLNPDGTMNLYISPMCMRDVAAGHGFRSEDVEMHLDILTVLPTRRLKPRKRYPQADDCIGMHRVLGSWRRRKLSRRIEKRLEHWWRVVKHYMLPAAGSAEKAGSEHKQAE